MADIKERSKSTFNQQADTYDEDIHGQHTFELSMQFRIITEYVTPNYENIYPDDITKYMEPISWDANFGESYFITIIGDKTNGYKAILK